MNKFAERLTEELKVKEISQNKFATRMQTNQQTVNRWCNGVNEPSYDTLIQICKELEISSDYLLGIED